jgi:YesN/AraC family two-component response regulator
MIDKKLNFLLVEDDVKTLELLRRDLNELEIANNIFTAFNGNEAITLYREKSKEHTIDIIFSDVVMPICNGIEFLEKFRKEIDPTNKKNIIMLTSKSDRSIVLKTINFGVTIYLLKPWNQQTLIQKIMTILEEE